jgi:hypothetical protein
MFGAVVVGTSAHGCGSSGSVVAHFSLTAGITPQMMDVPFPTDAYLDATGHITNPIPGFDNIITQNGDLIERELAELDGFSRITHALFWVDDLSLPLDDNGNVQSATIDQGSLPFDEVACTSDTASVYLVDLDAQTRVPCRAYFQDDRDIGSESHPVIAVGPARGVVLPEGHHVAAVLTSRIHDTKGRNVKASDSFTALANVTAPSATEKLYQTALTGARTLLSSALADGTTIVSIAPFTTHTRAGELFQARTALDTIAVPTLSFAAQDLAPMGAARF